MALSRNLYPTVFGIDFQTFQLPSTGLSKEERTKAYLMLSEYEKKQASSFLGYQCNENFRYSEELTEFLQCSVNNIGDPFQSGNATVNSKWMERAVLDYYCTLWNGVFPHDPKNIESYWGYVLSMGATEGNLYGLWNARDYLSGRALQSDCWNGLSQKQALLPEGNSNAFTPIVFFSEDTHYSIVKALAILQLWNFSDYGKRYFPSECPIHNGQWPNHVPSNVDGSVNIHNLETLVSFFAARGFSIMIIFNYGTTFKGAYDDVEGAGSLLQKVFLRYGLADKKVEFEVDNPQSCDHRTGYWVHVDGALGAAYMPFIEMAHSRKKIDSRGPNFDFRLPFVHSIVMSGHKWIGSPFPTGIFMTKVKYQLRPPSDPEYLGSLDSTFAGSRNGFSAMILWDYLARNGFEDQIERALLTEKNAEMAFNMFKQLEHDTLQDLWVERSPLSLAVRFKKASEEIIFRYSLPCETVLVQGEKRCYNHLFSMPGVTVELLDEFFVDLRKTAFPPQ